MRMFRFALISNGLLNAVCGAVAFDIGGKLSCSERTVFVSPAIGIISGGVVGPIVGLLVPARLAAETAPLGSLESADRFAMPDTHVSAAPGNGDPPPVPGGQP